ncbi:hypothetical protein HSX11_25800 [Oxalobacteraceae bacterium]|nr:hypothetical protein [Oxalobacteraceae bacterium]
MKMIVMEKPPYHSRNCRVVEVNDVNDIGDEEHLDQRRGCLMVVIGTHSAYTKIPAIFAEWPDVDIKSAFMGVVRIKECEF